MDKFKLVGTFRGKSIYIETDDVKDIELFNKFIGDLIYNPNKSDEDYDKEVDEILKK